MDQVNLTIAAGSFVALSGHSGAGKTTTVDLVIGLLRPTHGRVTVDGIDLLDINTRRWRESIGYVPQETFLFHDTIFANVTLGDPAISREAVRDALGLAEALDFVDTLDHGLDEVAGERGMKFSGGQRQRIAIARALVRRPNLLILDEATTSLDPKTELGICATIANLRERDPKLTVLAISHQRALIDAADMVVTVADGRLAMPAPARSVTR